MIVWINHNPQSFKPENCRHYTNPHRASRLYFFKTPAAYRAAAQTAPGLGERLAPVAWRFLGWLGARLASLREICWSVCRLAHSKSLKCAHPELAESNRQARPAPPLSAKPRANLMSGKETSTPAAKAPRTRRKVFCREPPRSLIISTAAVSDPLTPIRQNVMGCNMKSKQRRRVTPAGCRGPGGPTRVDPQQNATECNTTPRRDPV